MILFPKSILSRGLGSYVRNCYRRVSIISGNFEGDSHCIRRAKEQLQILIMRVRSWTRRLCSTNRYLWTTDRLTIGDVYSGKYRYRISDHELTVSTIEAILTFMTSSLCSIAPLGHEMSTFERDRTRSNRLMANYSASIGIRRGAGANVDWDWILQAC